MSAAEVLKLARATGISVMVDGDNIMLEASAEPPADMLDALRKHKADIIAVLRSGVGGVSQESPEWCPTASPKPQAPPNSSIVPTEFLKEVRRSGAKLIPVGNRLEPRGGGSPKLLAEFEHHRVASEKIVGAERLGGIAVETATATAVILLSYGVRAQLLTTIPEATASINQLLVAVGNDGVIGADVETTPLAGFAAPRPPLNITAAGTISSKQPAWNNDAGLDPYRAEVRVLSL